MNNSNMEYIPKNDVTNKNELSTKCEIYSKLKKHTHNIIQIFNDENKLHSLISPSYIETNKKGDVITECWFKDGLIHRDNDYACTYIKYNYRNETRVITKKSFIDGKFHSINNNSAIISYEEDNRGDVNVVDEKWFLNNVLHRDDDKPAFRYRDYDYDGDDIIVVGWCINGKLMRMNVSDPHKEIYYDDDQNKLKRQECIIEIPHNNDDMLREENINIKNIIDNNDDTSASDVDQDEVVNNINSTLSEHENSIYNIYQILNDIPSNHSGYGFNY